MQQVVPTTQRQYFLGIGGQQSGPFSETEVIQKIKEGTVSTDTMVWYEGLPEWQPISSITALAAAFSPSAPRTEAVPPQKNQEKVSTFAEKESLEPVFQEDEAVFESAFVRFRIHFIVGGIVIALAVGVSLFYWIASRINRPRVEEPLVSTQKPPENQRENQLRKAVSDMLISPQESLNTLMTLINDNPNDRVAQEATQTALDYYKRVIKPTESGRVLMAARRPLEAAKYFLMDPPSYSEAEGAYYAAYLSVNDKVKKRQALIEDIRLLLNQLNNLKLAIERIQLLQKEFPNEPHPYGYYLRPPEERLKDIFNRISFYFVQNLMAFFASEFPQINLLSRPLVELKKDASEKYRIVGSYRGDVLLNQDRLSNIYFVFWLSKEQWRVVDTNLTEERRKWARQVQQQHIGEVLSAQEMLRDLEQIFKTQFPKNALHESIARIESKALGISTNE